MSIQPAATQAERPAVSSMNRPMLSPVTQSPTESMQSPTSPSFLPLQTMSEDPQDTPELKPFFQNYSASQSSSRLQPMEGTIRQVSEGDLTRSASKEKSELYTLRRTSGSTPDLSKSNVGEGLDFSGEPGKLVYLDDYVHALIRRVTEEAVDNPVIARRPVGAPPRPGKPIPARTAPRKNKPKPFAHLLSRSRSIRMDPNAPQTLSSNPNQNRFGESNVSSRSGISEDSTGMRTAPLQQDRERSFRDMMSSTIRHRSADRHTTADSENGSVGSGGERQNASFASSFKDGTGAVLLSNLKSSSTKAAGGIGKAGKGIFGKLGRSGSSGDNVTDENYKCIVISLPLVEQTRRTRISKRLENSKDKTEFWMPALPWRCIE